MADPACAWKDLSTKRIEPPSWTMMKRLTARGVAGIIAPSFAIGAAGAEVNAIFWKWRATPPYKLKVIDDAARLPKDMRSWT